MQNAVSILQQLDSGEISERLTELNGERKALMTLLRAAKARERSIATRKSGPQRSEGEGSS